MKVTVVANPAESSATITIHVEHDSFSPFIDKAVEKLSTDHPLKGFRAGKAPVHMVVETYGQDRVIREAIDTALPHFFVKAVTAHNIEAVNQPNVTIEQAGLTGPIQFTATVDVLPHINLPDVTSLSAKRKTVTVDDSLVDRELMHLARSRSSLIDVTRPAQINDVVLADFTISVDGTVLEEGISKNHPITIGEGYFLPEFEHQLIGTKPGETRAFTLNFPSDFARKNLRNKNADAKVTIHAVQHRILPEMTDTFAKSLGTFNSLEHLKHDLRENLKLDLEQKEEDRFQKELAVMLAEKATFTRIPPILIERQIDQQIQEFESLLSLQNKTLDDFLAREQKDRAQLRKNMESSAITSIKVSLALQAFTKKEHIEVTDEEIHEEANRQLRRYNKIEQAQTDMTAREMQQSIGSMLRNRKTLARLAKMVEGTPRSQHDPLT